MNVIIFYFFFLVRTWHGRPPLKRIALGREIHHQKYFPSVLEFSCSKKSCSMSDLGVESKTQAEIKGLWEIYCVAPR